ncbi:hypothetical protein Desku_0904 [Desulfofundulus kuznetsovii DSM 6115]|uniref:Uncharacterized protein n=1 Tax=Desulfofundulus kuznetsovii (strain DSM 6115 / VKM B-1805 / 17) TaxID=760568 RepID=A0AAU8Q1F2_DESK7|nr:hypothetical protein Desku_0904 [Desulfofundulus kuznetsovii DSM 6115]
MSEKTEKTLYDSLPADILKKVVRGEIDSMSPEEMTVYYRAVCESLGLNPLTRPFDFIRPKKGDSRVILYARRDCADQLAAKHKLSRQIINREKIGDTVYAVTARVTGPDGRVVEATGAVGIAGLRGDDLANRIMIAETKAYRRGVLAYAGLGWVDETELETIPELRDEFKPEPGPETESAGPKPEQQPNQEPEQQPNQEAVQQPKQELEQQPEQKPEQQPEPKQGEDFEGELVVLEPPEEKDGWKKVLGFTLVGEETVSLVTRGKHLDALASQDHIFVKGQRRGDKVLVSTVSIIKKAQKPEPGEFVVVVKSPPREAKKTFESGLESITWTRAVANGEEVLLVARGANREAVKVLAVDAEVRVRGTLVQDKDKKLLIVEELLEPAA